MSIQLSMKRYFNALYEKVLNGEEDNKRHISDGVQYIITVHLCTETAKRKFCYKKLCSVYNMWASGILSDLSHVKNHNFLDHLENS